MAAEWQQSICCISPPACRIAKKILTLELTYYHIHICILHIKSLYLSDLLNIKHEKDQCALAYCILMGDAPLDGLGLGRRAARDGQIQILYHESPSANEVRG